jgi:hypothetical protein
MLGAVGHVALRQHIDAGDRYNPQLQAADQGHLPLRHARQHHQHPVAFPDALARQQIGEAVGQPRDIGVGVAFLSPFRAGPQERHALRVFGEAIDHIGAEVEGGGHVPFEAGLPALLFSDGGRHGGGSSGIFLVQIALLRRSSSMSQSA